MKIKQLIKKLSELNQNAEVVVSSDAEGNSFSRLDNVYAPSGLKYIHDQYGITIITEEEAKEYCHDYKKAKNCIVLFP